MISCAFMMGPIPARTGQPWTPFGTRRESGAYPRSHGATFSEIFGGVQYLGLSPLARGNLLGALGLQRTNGPIPARTGQPQPGSQCHRPPGAYPRSHGATVPWMAPPTVIVGLSPLARGNLSGWKFLQLRCGPIPARTGQPRNPPALQPPQRAYPRSHGATRASKFQKCGRWGLSPLARGNPTKNGPLGYGPGPIPARTGQPGTSRSACLALRAYPRSHGATALLTDWGLGHWGLSPLARGNHQRHQSGRRGGGPIPARTGQPIRAGARKAVVGAYPRSHGATQRPCPRSGPARGLSPLARGNHDGLGRCFVFEGPIPARTGQPRWPPPWPSWAGAYPRSHGATSRGARADLLPLGLSPLARGNHTVGTPATDVMGPIPARTGQPHLYLYSLRSSRAYPRSHGATTVLLASRT